jgi:hypothetical protein
MTNNFSFVNSCRERTFRSQKKFLERLFSCFFFRRQNEKVVMVLFGKNDKNSTKLCNNKSNRMLFIWHVQKIVMIGDFSSLFCSVLRTKHDNADEKKENVSNKCFSIHKRPFSTFSSKWERFFHGIEMQIKKPWISQSFDWRFNLEKRW